MLGFIASMIALETNRPAEIPLLRPLLNTVRMSLRIGTNAAFPSAVASEYTTGLL
jgi:hypothetical protein